MSYFTELIAQDTKDSRSRFVVVLLGALVVGQLFAFWLLCSHQVRKAEARNSEAMVQQMALADCLQYIPGSTIASCTGRAQAQAHAPRGTEAAALGAVPVSYTYR
jgi:hypothetical protein